MFSLLLCRNKERTQNWSGLASLAVSQLFGHSGKAGWLCSALLPGPHTWCHTLSVPTEGEAYLVGKAVLLSLL